MDPRWLLKDGQRVGFIFTCPLEPSNRNRRQTCLFIKMARRDQWTLWEENGFDSDDRCMIQGCKEECAWLCTPAPELADFSTISVMPSLDGSPGGNWHGHIANGQIVGGI